MLRPYIHILLHFLVPFLVARVAYPSRWMFAMFIMLLAFAIDLDHLLADPVYDPDRCSIGFHPLHTGWAAGLYVVLAVVPLTRLLGIGLIIHLLLDGVDCLWLQYG